MLPHLTPFKERSDLGVSVWAISPDFELLVNGREDMTKPVLTA
jgi:hypothetical protein